MWADEHDLPRREDRCPLEVRINCVVHVNSAVHVTSALAPDSVVPIEWIAVGDPAELFPHEEIGAIQKGLDFPGTVFGLPRPPVGETIQPEAMRRYADWLAAHTDDRVLDRDQSSA